MNKTLAIAITGLMTVWAGRADASIIEIGTVSDQGTGFGNVLNILSLHDNGSEIGSVSWNGSSDVETGDATNTSQTLTIEELLNAGILSASELGIVYNVNQQGNLGGLDTQLNGFTVIAYSSTGAVLDSWSYAGGGTCTPNTGDPDCFPPLANGQGGAGYLFGFDGTQAAELQVYFGDPTNRIGMSGDVSLANDGPENFYAHDLSGDEPDVTAVPEPTSMFLLGTGLLGLAGKLRARRKK